MALPETVIIDVGDLIQRLRAVVAHKLKLSHVEIDNAYSPSNVNIDEYIEMVVDSLVSQAGALDSLNQLISMALNDKNGALDERICDVMELMGQLIHQQLDQLRLYEPDNGPLHYFYTSRGFDWILLTRMSHASAAHVLNRIGYYAASDKSKAVQPVSTSTPRPNI